MLLSDAMEKLLSGLTEATIARRSLYSLVFVGEAAEWPIFLHKV